MELGLQIYGPGHIESFLLNYEVLVRDLAEVAADWPTLDSQEQSHHRAELMQVWGNRKVLGSLFRAERLSVSQQVRLAKLDRLLLEQASLMEHCYGLDLSQLLAIFRWGTPLANSSQPVRVEVEPASLDRVVTALADSVVRNHSVHSVGEALCGLPRWTGPRLGGGGPRRVPPTGPVVPVPFLNRLRTTETRFPIRKLMDRTGGCA